jgi:hypothetical protein
MAKPFQSSSHERRCTNVLSIWIQDGKKIEARLLAALVSTWWVSTSTSTISTDSRHINFNSRIGHNKTNLVWQESLFDEIFTPNVLPLCSFPRNLSRIDVQS